MRIVSLLPAATEIVAVLGLIDHLVGVSHECDFPVEVNALPRVMTCPIYKAGLTSAEIDARVRESIAKGLPLYQIDIPLLESLQPDLVLSQMFVRRLRDRLWHRGGRPGVDGIDPPVSVRSSSNLEPRRLDDLYANIRDVAAAVDDLSAEPLNARAHAEVVIADLKRTGDGRRRPGAQVGDTAACTVPGMDRPAILRRTLDP